MDNDFEIFEGKSFKNLCGEIYDRSDNKKEQLDLLISELRPMVRSIDDAQQIVPLIQGYLEISVRNDEQLVKLAQVVQRLQATKVGEGAGALLSDAEKEQLWKEVKDVTNEVKTPIPDAHDVIAVNPQ
jgi:hypothetical protein